MTELARRCNKSLTSFKKDFKQHFHETPHKWLLKQRLMHSRLLLTSTGKSVSEIGLECNFPNTSHYIKLFKQEYGVTPAIYRSRDRQPEGQDRQPEGQDRQAWIAEQAAAKQVKQKSPELAEA